MNPDDLINLVTELKTRLVAIENFLEIRERDNPLEANSLDNRIIDGMNANADAMNDNLDIAIKALEARLLDRLVAIEASLED